MPPSEFPLAFKGVGHETIVVWLCPTTRIRRFRREGCWHFVRGSHPKTAADLVHQYVVRTGVWAQAALADVVGED